MTGPWACRSRGTSPASRAGSAEQELRTWTRCLFVVSKAIGSSNSTRETSPDLQPDMRDSSGVGTFIDLSDLSVSDLSDCCESDGDEGLVWAAFHSLLAPIIILCRLEFIRFNSFPRSLFRSASLAVVSLEVVLNREERSVDLALVGCGRFHVWSRLDGDKESSRPATTSLVFPLGVRSVIT
eukprot:2634099-Rhodomonas_salina.3